MLLRSLLRKQILFGSWRQVSVSQLRKLGKSACEMAEHSYTGTSLPVILERLQKFAPLSLASSWDNVGLLVDPMSTSNITNILLTNDLTEDIVQEAINTNSGLIISYHPNIFQGLKSVSSSTWKERIVIQCLKNNIAVFSPHTSWDAVKGGVNDWLAQALPVEKMQPVMPYQTDSDIGAGRFCTLSSEISIGDVVTMVKNHIGIGHVRLALARSKTEDAPIKTVALCAGSGNSVLSGIEADLYLTGEMMHHDVLDATQKGIHVILTNHSDSERGFLRSFQEELEMNIMKGEAKVIVSKLDRDPLKTV